MRRCLTLFTCLCLAVMLPAQQRATVTATVRNEKGDSVPFARVHATMTGTEVTISANARGVAVLSLPFGRAHLTVSTLGYESLERDFTIDQPTVRAEFVLRATTQQLTEVNVRAKWIGIRGGVGDETTRQPVPGALVTLARGNIRVVTDSAGRFEIPMTKAEAGALQIAKDGYETKLVAVEVLPDQPSDIIAFIKRGKDLPYMKVALGDLRIRMASTKMFGFSANHEQLSKGNPKSLYDAIMSSGLLTKKNMAMGDLMCLFVNGLARPGFLISTVNVDDVDFIEVYGKTQEVTGTLMTEWPIGQPCTSHAAFFPVLKKPESRRNIGIVSVWLRK